MALGSTVCVCLEAREPERTTGTRSRISFLVIAAWSYLSQESPHRAYKMAPAQPCRADCTQPGGGVSQITHACTRHHVHRRPPVQCRSLARYTLTGFYFRSVFGRDTTGCRRSPLPQGIRGISLHTSQGPDFQTQVPEWGMYVQNRGAPLQILLRKSPALHTQLRSLHMQLDACICVFCMNGSISACADTHCAYAHCTAPGWHGHTTHIKHRHPCLKSCP